MLIHIFTQNNQETLERTLDSILPLDGEIYIFDRESKDKTIEIAKKYTKNISTWNKTRFEARKSILHLSNWHFYIEPWEALGSGHDKIRNIEFPANYRLFLSGNDILTKPVRLYHKTTFSNKTFHSYPKEIVDAVIYAKGGENEIESEGFEKVISYFNKQKYDNFIVEAQNFLFLYKKNNINVILIRYYLAWVYCIIKSEPNEALKNLLICLSIKPNMAEFWCLLADIHYFLLKEIHKSYVFYENAITAGKTRKIIDEYPVQLSKYNEYPEKMKQNCLFILSNFKK